jgi:hypothetical protein
VAGVDGRQVRVFGPAGKRARIPLRAVERADAEVNVGRAPTAGHDGQRARVLALPEAARLDP